MSCSQALKSKMEKMRTDEKSMIVDALPRSRNPDTQESMRAQDSFSRPWHLEPKVGGASAAALHMTPTLLTPPTPVFQQTWEAHGRKCI